MDVVWEELPPGEPRGARFGREPSPLRKEADGMKDTLRQNQGRWARLWDLETKEDARKRCNFAGSKGFSFSVRQTDHGWSVFGRYNGEPEPGPVPDDPGTPPPEPVPVPEPDVPQEEVRQPTFQ